MAAPKGQIKKGGRTKGTPNKTPQFIRDAFSSLVENNLSTLQDDFKKLNESDRIKYTIELAKFCLPTLKAIEMQGEIKTTQRQPIIFIKK